MTWGLQMWHPEHFTCESCHRPFGVEETYYEKDGHAYCSPCNERLFLMCPSCQLPVTADQVRTQCGVWGDTKVSCCLPCGVVVLGVKRRCVGVLVSWRAQDGISALGRNWHREHFTCAHGGCAFTEGVYFTKVRVKRLSSQERGRGRRLRMDNSCSVYVVPWRGTRQQHRVCRLSCMIWRVLSQNCNDGKGERPYCEDHYTELFVPKVSVCHRGGQLLLPVMECTRTRVVDPPR